MKILQSFLWHWLPVIIWAGVIYYFSSRQRVALSDSQPINFLLFKSFHVIEYGLLFTLIRRAVKYATTITNYSLIAFVLTIFYAITDELHQTFVPTREGSIRDVIIDAVGAGIAWYALSNILPVLPKKLSNWLVKLRLI